MKRRYGKAASFRKNARVRILLILLVVAASGAIAFITVSLRLRPIISDIASSKAQFIAERAINDSVSEEFLANSSQYQDIIKLEKSSDNQILAINTDIIKINSMKAQIVNRITDKLKATDVTIIKIPIGSLMGSDIFYGRGPKIAVKLMPLGSATANFISAFESAGINQTRHRIIIEAEISMSMLLPGGAETVLAKSEISIAETILVGSVPESYTYIEDGHEEGAEKLFDFASNIK